MQAWGKSVREQCVEGRRGAAIALEARPGRRQLVGGGSSVEAAGRGPTGESIPLVAAGPSETRWMSLRVRLVPLAAEMSSCSTSSKRTDPRDGCWSSGSGNSMPFWSSTPSTMKVSQ